MIRGERTKKCINELIESKKEPYLDVILTKGSERLFRYYKSGEFEATGKERLYLYSCTKVFTAVCALQLIGEGKLKLSDEVSKYLPEYKNTFLLDGEGNKKPTKNKMTVHDLFTMSGGLSYDMIVTPHIRDIVERSGGKAGTVELANAFAGLPLKFEPSTRYEYSVCLDVLAAVVEVVSGRRFSEYMEERIFAPLGITDLGFHKYRGITQMYSYRGDSYCECEPHVKLFLGENYDSGGAGLVGGVDGMSRFACALAQGGVGENGKRIIGEETLALIREPQYKLLTPDNAITRVLGDDYAYGLGVRVRLKDSAWGLPAGEYGWTGAAGSDIMVDPVNKISVVIGRHLHAGPTETNGKFAEIQKALYEDLREEGLL